MRNVRWPEKGAWGRQRRNVEKRGASSRTCRCQAPLLRFEKDDAVLVRVDDVALPERRRDRDVGGRVGLVGDERLELRAAGRQGRHKGRVDRATAPAGR